MTEMKLRQRRPSPDTVFLTIDGPRSILPGPTICQARLNESWRDLLAMSMKLDLESTPGRAIICSSRYVSKRSTLGGGGHYAELTEKVEDFINKYKKRRKMYSVRIRCEDKEAVKHQQRSNTFPGTSKKGKRRTSPPTPAPERFNNRNCDLGARSMAVSPTVTGLSTSQFCQELDNNSERPNMGMNKIKDEPSSATGIQNGVPSPPVGYPMPTTAFENKRKRLKLMEHGPVVNNPPVKQENHECIEEPIWEQNWDASDDDGAQYSSASVSSATTGRQTPNEATIERDDESCVTTASEEDELRRDGISIRNIRETFNRISDEELLRWGKECVALKAKNRWSSVAKLAPLTAHHASDIFDQIQKK